MSCDMSKHSLSQLMFFFGVESDALINVASATTKLLDNGKLITIITYYLKIKRSKNKSQIDFIGVSCFLGKICLLLCVSMLSGHTKCIKAIECVWFQMFWYTKASE